MSKWRDRSKEARLITQHAESLGYRALGRTQTGHLRFAHTRTGAIVVCPSKGTAGAAMRNAQAELRRGTAQEAPGGPRTPRPHPNPSRPP
jgi:hypothetical protein